MNKTFFKYFLIGTIVCMTQLSFADLSGASSSNTSGYSYQKYTYKPTDLTASSTVDVVKIDKSKFVLTKESLKQLVATGARPYVSNGGPVTINKNDKVVIASMKTSKPDMPFIQVALVLPPGAVEQLKNLPPQVVSDFSFGDLVSVFGVGADIVGSFSSEYSGDPSENFQNLDCYA